MVDVRLLQLAAASDEVLLVSALLQDAVVQAADSAWQSTARCLVLLVNRYRWASSDASRVRCAIGIESVVRLQRCNWPSGKGVLVLLAITMYDDMLTLLFAAGATMRAKVECVDVVLEDMSEPWPARREPAHHNNF